MQFTCSALVFPRVLFVQRHVQHKDVHARLTQKSKLAAFRMLGHQPLQVRLADAPGLGNTRDLEVSPSGRDMRIEAGARGCNQINWNWSSWILCLQGCNVALYPVNHLLIVRTVVASPGLGGIVTIPLSQ